MDHGRCFGLCLTFLTVTCCFTEADVSITTAAGHDCVLWCAGLKDLRVTVLEWTSEQNKDLLVFRGGKVLEGYEHPDYTNRVRLSIPLLKDGLLSVVLKKVTVQDSGTYRCEAEYEDGQEISEDIHLTVTAGVYVSVTVPEGMDCVLPCSGLRGHKVFYTNWFPSDQEKDTLRILEELQPPTYQLPEYKDRVELQDPELQSTDLSLVLKKVTVQDSGTYECLASYADGEETRVISHFIHLTVTDQKRMFRGLSPGVVLGFGFVVIVFCIGLNKLKRSQFFSRIISRFKSLKKRTSSFSKPSEQLEMSAPPSSDSDTPRNRVL